MSEQLLGNERVIRKLVREGDPLVDRVISWAENVKKTLSGKGEKFTLAEKRRMDKALKLYLKAAEAAGNRDLVKRILAIREEDEENNSAENEHLNTLSAKNQQKESLTNINQGNMHVSSFSHDFADSTFNSFGITNPSDYIHVQRKVFDTLLNEGFFTNTETRSRTDINAESGMVIETNKSGIFETFSLNNYGRLGKFKKIAKLATIRNLPDAIKYGHIVMDNADNIHDSTDNNKKFAYIEYATEVDDKEIILKLAIKKSPQKNKFWVHSIYTIENVSDSPASTNNGTEAGHITADSKEIIPQDFNSVNSETKFSYKAPAESKVYKQIAEWEKLKVYEKADAEKMLYMILSDVMTFSEDQAAVMTLEGRKDAEQLLWAEPNKKAERENRPAF